MKERDLTPARSSARTRTVAASAVLASGVLLSLAAGLADAVPLTQLPAAACTASTLVQVSAPELRLGAQPRCDARFAAPWEALRAPAEPYNVVISSRAASPLRPPQTEPLARESLSPAWDRFPVMASGGAADVASPAGTAWDILERIRSASVSIERDAASRACDRWLFGRWFCGPADWNYVGPAEIQVRGRSERCLWLHPTDEGEVVVRFRDVPGGQILRGRMALADSAADKEDGAAVRLELRTWPNGGERPEVPSLDRDHNNRRGWSSWRLELPDAELVSVELRVSSEDVGQRHFCLTGTARPAPRDGADDTEPSLPVGIEPDAGGEGSGATEGSAPSEGSAASERRRPTRTPRERERVPGRMFLENQQVAPGPDRGGQP